MDWRSIILPDIPLLEISLRGSRNVQRAFQQAALGKALLLSQNHPPLSVHPAKSTIFLDEQINSNIY